MRNIHVSPTPDPEPWLSRLRAGAPLGGQAAPNAGLDGDEDFVQRVMDAPPAPDAEPWLEWLAVEGANAAPGNPAFAGNVADAFAAGNAKRAVAGRIGRIAAGLAACIALGALFWPQAAPPPAPSPVAMAVIPPQPAAQATPLAVAVQQTAEDWVTHQTRQAATTWIATKNQAATVLSKYALPIQASCYFLGLGIPATPSNAAPRNEEQPHSWRDPSHGFPPPMARLS